MRIFIIIVCITSLCCTSVEEQSKYQTISPKVIVFDTLPLYYSPAKAVNTLGTKEESIVVSYAAISCECAQWIIEEEIEKKSNHTKEAHIYLEPAETTLADADTLWDGLTLPFRLRLTGKFYKEIGYPPGYKPIKGDPKPARVFEYNKLSIIRSK